VLPLRVRLGLAHPTGLNAVPKARRWPTLYDYFVNTTPPDYNAIYFDSNELLASGWPDPSVRLSNLLHIGRWWDLQPFIPQPVLDETEAHWRRSVETKSSKLDTAKKEFERIARPVACDINVEYASLQEMRIRYEAIRKEALSTYGIGVIPYPNRTADFFFQRATNYVMPFEKDGEGKGFQDAVILQSVLEHLHSNGNLKGILITMDGGMKQARIREFLPEFDASKLRFTTLDEAWNSLFEYHFDQTVVQPWAEERKNALTAVEALAPVWKEFLATHLTESMLRAGGFGQPTTVVKLISVDSVNVTYVDTPIPDLNAAPDRPVKILIKLSGECTAIVRKEHFSFFSEIIGDGQPTSQPEIVQEKASWSGGIRATANVVSRQFQDIFPESIVLEEELRSQK
jgi:hypothetical protein